MMSDFCPDMYMYIINMHKKSNNLVGKIAHNLEQLWHIILIKAVFFLSIHKLMYLFSYKSGPCYSKHH